MTQFDQKLEDLRQQMAQKNRLEKVLSDLKEQRRELTVKAAELEKIKIKEQTDVNKLEGRSLSAFFYYVTGKKEAMLDREQQEAYAAGVKYDAAISELHAVEADILSHEASLRNIQRCEQLYQQTLQEKAEYIKNSGCADADALMELEHRLSDLENQEKELAEAISAGNSAHSIAENVLSHLDSAKGWSNWDMFGGGGLFTDMAKYGHLDDAQSLIETLQVQLRRFKTELNDVTMEANIQVNIDNFLRFADYFFDGFFVDWTVRNKISDSQNQIKITITQIENILKQLNAGMASVKKEQNTTKSKMDHLVKQTKA